MMTTGLISTRGQRYQKYQKSSTGRGMAQMPCKVTEAGRIRINLFITHLDKTGNTLEG